VVGKGVPNSGDGMGGKSIVPLKANRTGKRRLREREGGDSGKSEEDISKFWGATFPGKIFGMVAIMWKK